MPQSPDDHGPGGELISALEPDDVIIAMSRQPGCGSGRQQRRPEPPVPHCALDHPVPIKASDINPALIDENCPTAPDAAISTRPAEAFAAWAMPPDGGSYVGMPGFAWLGRDTGVAKSRPRPGALSR